MLASFTAGVVITIFLGGGNPPNEGAEWRAPDPAEELMTLPQASSLLVRVPLSAAKAFWRILKATERSFLHLYIPML